MARATRLLSLILLIGALSCGSGPSPTPDPTPAPPAPAALYYLAHDSEARARVWRQGRQGQDPEIVSPEGVSVESYSFLPAGQGLVYATLEGLYHLPPGQAPRRLAAAGDSQPDASPDGRWVAYVQQGIWLLALDGSQPPRRLAADPAGETLHNPRWSPDGQQLLVRVTRQSGLSSTYRYGLLSLADGRLAGIPETDGLEAEAVWAPDGSVLIAAARAGLARYQPGAPDVRRLLPADYRVLAPAVRPDGRVAALLGTGEGQDAVRPHTLRLEGGGLQAESSASYPFVLAAWSPDGRYLAGLANCQWSQRRGCSGTLYLVDLATGQESRPVQVGPAWALAWGPEG